MYRTPFVFAPLVLLIVAGLLLGGALVIHDIGWSEGYRVAQLADGATAAPPLTAHGPGGWSLLATLGVGFLLLLIVGRLLRLWAWSSAWRHCGDPDSPAQVSGKCWGGRPAGHHHWHHPYPPMPPWCEDWHRARAQETTAPDADTDAAPGKPENQPA